MPLPWCLIDELRAEQQSDYEHGIQSHVALGLNSDSRYGLMCSLSIHLEACLSLIVPTAKGVVIAPRVDAKIEGEIPFKAPSSRCSAAVTYSNKGDGGGEAITFLVLQ